MFSGALWSFRDCLGLKRLLSRKMKSAQSMPPQSPDSVMVAQILYDLNILDDSGKKIVYCMDKDQEALLQA